MAITEVGAKQESRRKRGSRTVLLPILAALAAGVTGLVIGGFKADRTEDIWFEVAKAGLQLMAVGVLGGAVAYAYKALEQRRADHQKEVDRAREELRHRNEQRLVVFREIVDAYNRVKAVRRILRSLGLRGLTDPLSTEQANGFREQMLFLNDAQLSFEGLKRALAESALFDCAAELIGELDTVEHYLNTVLKGWEDHAWQLHAGASWDAVASPELKKFVGDLKQYADFKAEASAPLMRITKLMHEELFEPPSAATSRAAKALTTDVEE